MQFSQVIGQKDLKEQLMHMVQHNRLSHALLFLGKEGSGALSLARAMAQYTVCEKVNGKASANPLPAAAAGPSLFGEAFDDPAPNPEAESGTTLTDSCGECPSCLKAAKLIHPDIHYSFPVIPKKSGDKPVSNDYIIEWRQFIEKYPYGNNYDWLQFIDAENKQGNITSEECKEIIHTMSLKSFEAEYKILIMWMPEMLGKEGNKLLKLIEEPPPNSLFIFVAENDALILPTILSRTQLIKVPPLQADEIATALTQNEGTPPAKAQQVASVSEGNYHEALQQLGHADDDWEVILRDWLNSIAKTGPAAQVKWIEEISKTGREKQKQFLQYFNHLLEHAIRLRIAGQEAGSGNKNDDFALRLNKLCSLEQQEAISQELDNAIYYIERNANAKMLFHALTIKLYHIISNNSIILVS
ncbi:MAG: DNA polymerase III subunit delta' [Chitinophagaceae bacterium]|nr:MAG: DNA polymerase III subunit delta' [Chitinophagaceae bacterium]